MSRYNKNIGDWGEDRAVEFLVGEGYSIVERNYRCKFGEIDIIASKSGTIHFVEVKTRSGYAFGSPLSAINHKKLKHIQSASQYYINANRLHAWNISIDGIAVVGDKLEHVQGINM